MSALDYQRALGWKISPFKSGRQRARHLACADACCSLGGLQPGGEHWHEARCELAAQGGVRVGLGDEKVMFRVGEDRRRVLRIGWQELAEDCQAAGVGSSPASSRRDR